ncbi:MAG: bacteriohemerythrin, partial [Spirochaetota bacterium]
VGLGKGRLIICDILDELLNYSNYHFNAEEAIMKEINYPYYDQHKDEHEVFISEVNELVSTYKNGNYDVTVKTLDFLYYWILNHILASDKKISNFIKNNS